MAACPDGAGAGPCGRGWRIQRSASRLVTPRALPLPLWTDGACRYFWVPPSRTVARRAAAFQRRTAFEAVEGVADGLGPVFNGTSCAGCHEVGATGGGSELVETRFGTITDG